jgi:hypothetical protein
MIRRLVRALLCAVLLGSAAACDGGGPGRADATGQTPRVLRVTVVGDAADTRVTAVREALGHWNAEAARLGLDVRFDSGTVISVPPPEDAVRAASRSMPLGGFGVLRLRAALADVAGDIVIVLSRADVISFGATTGTGRVGIIGLRPADRWPLSLPNTARNLVAHELGRVLGLEHNADSTTLMCGRPAPCRPATFASERGRFFPLTARDAATLQARWGGISTR